jgi:F-box protein 9
MDPKDVPTNTEAELESFRQKWKDEVTARSKGKAPATASSASSKPPATKSNAPETHPHSQAKERGVEEIDEVTPYAYHDLGEKQHGRRLKETSAQTAAAVAASQEPSSALEHYEKAVEKESQGKLGDSVAHYRRAFKVRTTHVLE